jgi:hypothetical protein
MENMLTSRIDGSNVTFLHDTLKKYVSDIRFDDWRATEDEIKNCVIEWRAVTGYSSHRFEVCVIVEKVTVVFEDSDELVFLNSRNFVQFEVDIETERVEILEGTRSFYPKGVQFYTDDDHNTICEVTFNG